MNTSDPPTTTMALVAATNKEMFTEHSKLQQENFELKLDRVNEQLLAAQDKTKRKAQAVDEHLKEGNYDSAFRALLGSDYKIHKKVVSRGVKMQELANEFDKRVPSIPGFSDLYFDKLLSFMKEVDVYDGNDIETLLFDPFTSAIMDSIKRTENTRRKRHCAEEYAAKRLKPSFSSKFHFTVSIKQTATKSMKMLVIKDTSNHTAFSIDVNHFLLGSFQSESDEGDLFHLFAPSSEYRGKVLLGEQGKNSAADGVDMFIILNIYVEDSKTPFPCMVTFLSQHMFSSPFQVQGQLILDNYELWLATADQTRAQMKTSAISWATLNGWAIEKRYASALWDMINVTMKNIVCITAPHALEDM